MRPRRNSLGCLGCSGVGVYTDQVSDIDPSASPSSHAVRLQNDSGIPGLRPSIGYSAFWVLAGLAGWVVSFLLYLEYVGQLTDSTPIVSCSLSVVVSCTPNLLSPAGNLLGFSNSILGITLFLGPLYAGVSTLAGGRMRPWYWRVYLAFIAAAYVFVHTLAYRSIFEYRVLCPWCMVIWLVVIPLFWYTFAWSAKSGVLGGSTRWGTFGATLQSWAWVVVIADYLLIAVLAEVRLQAIESIFL